MGCKFENAMNRIRVGQSLVARAVSLLERSRKDFPASDHEMWSAVASAASGWYFACFRQSKLGPHLDFNHVYRGNDVALTWHRHWRKVRDLHIHHPDKVGRSIETGTVVDSEGQFIELFTVKMEKATTASEEEMNSLFRLLSLLSDYLSERATKINIAAQRSFANHDYQFTQNAPDLTIDKFLE
jgi:hypothetical protein